MKKKWRIEKLISLQNIFLISSLHRYAIYSLARWCIVLWNYAHVEIDGSSIIWGHGQIWSWEQCSSQIIVWKIQSYCKLYCWDVNLPVCERLSSSYQSWKGKHQICKTNLGIVHGNKTLGKKTIENTLQQNFNVSSNVEVFLHNITFL